MANEVAPGGSAAARVLLVVGGVVAIAGALLPWAKISADFSGLGAGAFSETLTGWDTNDGKVIVALAAVLVLIGLVVAGLRGRGARMAVGVLAGLGSIAVLAVGLYDAVQTSGLKDKALGSSSGQERAILEQFIRQGLLSIDSQPWVWLCVVGGALALIGSALALLSRRSEPVAPAIASSHVAPSTPPTPSPPPAAPPPPPPRSGAPAPPPPE
jgi:hypothetical protein